MLGRSYPGYYPLADERALARLIRRASSEREFYRRLTTAIVKRRHLFAPAAERRGVLAVVREAVGLAASDVHVLVIHIEQLDLHGHRSLKQQAHRRERRPVNLARPVLAEQR